VHVVGQVENFHPVPWVAVASRAAFARGLTVKKVRPPPRLEAGVKRNPGFLSGTPSTVACRRQAGASQEVTVGIVARGQADQTYLQAG